MFHVGQRVLCVNTSVWPGKGLPRNVVVPQKGSVYTVRAIVPTRELYGFDEDGLHLDEIVNRPHRLWTREGWADGFEVAFRMSRFRPLRSTSIDVFQKMLEPVPVSEPAELVD